MKRKKKKSTMTIVELTHSFLRVHDISALLKGNTFGAFKYQMKKQAEAYANKKVGKKEEVKKEGEKDREKEKLHIVNEQDVINEYKEKLQKEGAWQEVVNVYLGDAFEFLCEMIIKMYGDHPLIQIDPKSYEVINLDEDKGVDGFGIGQNGKVHTIQCKFKSDPTKPLTCNVNSLNNFTWHSVQPVEWGGFGVDINYRSPTSREETGGKLNMTIFHSCEEIHFISKGNWFQGIREIALRHIISFIDENDMFWNSFRESSKISLENWLKDDE